jgi:hypothetical protein
MGTIGGALNGKDLLQMVRIITCYTVNNILLIVLTPLFSSEADSPLKKRSRKPVVHFKSSRDVKTNVEMQTSYKNSKRKRDRINFESESELSNLVDEMKKSLPRKKINENVLAPLLEHAAETKDGRFGIAKAISKKANPNLPTGGKSKSAINRAKQTAGHLMVGLATILDPDNPDRLKSLMTGKKAGRGGFVRCSSSNESSQPQAF